MTAKLDEVKKGDRITAEAWNDLVRRVNALENQQRFNFVVPPKGGKSSINLRFMRLISDWTRNDAGTWQANAYFINEETGLVDTSSSVPVWWTFKSSTVPEGTAYGWSFWAIWRGRWEALQTSATKDPPECVAGDGIAVDSTTPGKRIISNAGITCAKIPGDSYEDAGALYFSKVFKWVESSLDIQGKKELSINFDNSLTATVATGIEITGNTITFTTATIGAFYVQ